MKNKFKLSFCLLLFAFSLQAQQRNFKLGLRFAPGLSMTRVQDINSSDFIKVTNGASKFRFSGGLAGDFYFARNYAFYSGFWYTAQNAGIKVDFDSSGTAESMETAVNIQTIQIPVSLKFFTNEVATDAKLYFVVGGSGSLHIKKIETNQIAKINSSRIKVSNAPDAYTLGDLGLLLGGGIEYRLGDATSVFGGITYSRGLTNIASKDGPIMVKGRSSSSLYDVNMGMICLEMGIYF
jgi:hypothetical protein